MCGGKSLHKKDWLKVGLAVAAATTGAGAAGLGPLAGVMGGAEAAGAAGAAGLGATGVAAGAGGTAGGMAALFGPEAGLAGGLLGSSTTPMITSLGTGAGIGGSSMFGAGQAASTLGSLGLTPEMSAGMNWGKGLETLQKANQYAKLAGGGQEQQQPQMAQRPQAQQQPQSDLEALYALIYPQRKRKDNGYV